MTAVTDTESYIEITRRPIPMTNKSKPTAAADSNIHKDHRKRMRAKLSASPESLSDHELVEMLLYNSIPRGNTNDQAHRLLDLGGSLRGILDLEAPQISSVKGLGESTVLLFRLLREFYIRTEKQKLDKRNQKKITRKNISEKLHKIFLGLKEERMIMMTVDKDCCLIKTHTIAYGNSNAAAISLKSMVRIALDDNASFVFIAHNHPNDVLAPSEDDLETTQLICEALALINVPVIEHYIVTSVSELGIIDRHNLFSRNDNKDKK